MIQAVAQDGYAQVAVEQVLGHCGASRSTFYEQFRSKEDCFLAAQAEISERLLRTLELEARLDEPSEIHETFIRVLMHFASSEQPSARLLLLETLASGPSALNARGELTRAFERVIERSWEMVPGQTSGIDLSARALVGAVLRMLAIRLRRGEGALHDLQMELTAWVECYRVSAEAPLRWRQPTCAPRPELLAGAPGAVTSIPEPLPRGRHKLSAAEVARNQCDRVLYAVAELAHQMGYATMTVTDICARSKVSRKIFYTHYADKEAAVLEAIELGFRQTTAVTSRAFFAAGDWPERVWAAGRAFAGFLVDHPALAWLGFIESYVIGAPAVQRAEDTQVSLTMLLHEGYGYRGDRKPPSASALEAIAAAAFELIHQQLRDQHEAALAGVLPEVVYMCLAPFIGPEAANLFITSQLEGN
ncbi:MAG: TetR/AcrR family transcriptional regulator [Solirubrobacteraceae bacterium]